MITSLVVSKTAYVKNSSELVHALNDKLVKTIVVKNSLSDLASFTLSEGKALIGENPDISLNFRMNSDGIKVESGVSICQLIIRVQRNFRAIYNATNIDNLGIFSLNKVSTVGQIQVIGKDALIKADIRFDDVNVIEADSYDRPERPSSGIGPSAGNVDIIQGAITIFNMQSDPRSIFNVRMREISIGSRHRPVRGSGVLLSGAAGNIYTHPGIRQGGQVVVSELETRDVYIHSQIPPNTANLIAGAVFVAYAKADKVRNFGDTVCFGNNGLGLDNWGDVRSWTSIGKVETFGNSGIGVVHFGLLEELSVASIETFGSGGRAFNALTGRIGKIEFGQIRTNGNGASGVYVRAEVGSVSIKKDLVTYGSSAMGLESGVISLQYAIALRVEDGVVGKIEVGGGIQTYGDGSEAISIEQGVVSEMAVCQDIVSSGMNTNAIRVSHGATPLINMRVKSSDGSAVFLDGARILALTGLIAEAENSSFFVATDSVVHTSATTVAELQSHFGNSFQVTGPGNLTLVP